MKKITFAERLKEARKAAKLSQEALAQKIGRTKSTISRWESGERNPKMFEMVELENALGVAAETLMYGTEKIKPSTLSEINKIAARLDERRQKVVLETAKSQLKEQETEKESASNIITLKNRASELTDEEFEKALDEAVKQTVAFDGKPLDEREQAIAKQMLRDAWEEDNGKR